MGKFRIFQSSSSGFKWESLESFRVQEYSSRAFQGLNGKVSSILGFKGRVLRRFRAKGNVSRQSRVKRDSFMTFQGLRGIC